MAILGILFWGVFFWSHKVLYIHLIFMLFFFLDIYKSDNRSLIFFSSTDKKFVFVMLNSE